MKRILLPALFALLITGCGGSATLSYDVEFIKTEDPERMAALTLATRHIVERRLSRLEGNLIDYDVAYDEETKETQVSVEVDNATAAKKLNEEMLAPFSFEFRVLVDEPQDGDIEVETVGFFREIGMGKEEIDWVLGETLDGPLKKGMVIIGFTDEGMAKGKVEFAKHTGKSIGLFVRGKLTASIKLSDKEVGRTVAIRGLPSGEIAKVFADDMNVGTHMIFTAR